MNRLKILQWLKKEGFNPSIRAGEETIYTKFISKIERLRIDNERFIKANIEVAQMNADYLIEITQLKKAGNKQDDEIYKLSCDMIVKNEEIDNLRAVNKQLGNDKALMHKKLGDEIERLRKENEEMIKCAELEEKHTNEVIAEHGMEYEKEIERLKKLIKRAYTEGWHDCYGHHEEYTIVNDWNKSKIKQTLKEE